MGILSLYFLIIGKMQSDLKNNNNDRHQDIQLEIQRLKIQKSILEEKLKLTELKIEGFEIMIKKEQE